MIFEIPRQVFSQVKVPFDCTIPLSEMKNEGIYLCGIPFDRSASFRKGAKKAPSAIRKASYQTETYSPYFDTDLENLNIFDLGDARMGGNQKKRFQEISAFLEKWLTETKKVVTLGGDHSISIAPIWAYHKLFPTLEIIQLDAHADLRESYQNNSYSHASIMARVSELGIKTHQYGIRSGTKEEFELMKSKDSRCESLEILLDRIEKCTNPIYLTLDLDFIDPSEFPGTGTPEAGGESFKNLIQILKKLSTKKFVGADITELAPPVDTSGNSTIFACKVVREVLMAVSR